jgi:hypothetical protein
VGGCGKGGLVKEGAPGPGWGKEMAGTGHAKAGDSLEGRANPPRTQAQLKDMAALQGWACCQRLLVSWYWFLPFVLLHAS